LEDIARYYRSYIQLMNHWDAVLPGKILRVQHENVVEDSKAVCVASWIFAVSNFKRRASSFTRPNAAYDASSEQVRRPIFKEGLISGAISSPGSSLSERLRDVRLAARMHRRVAAM